MFNGVFGIINFVLTKAIYDLTEVNNVGGYNNFECKNINMKDLVDNNIDNNVNDSQGHVNEKKLFASKRPSLVKKPVVEFIPAIEISTYLLYENHQLCVLICLCLSVPSLQNVLLLGVITTPRK